MWLTQGLTPSYKTIANFRKDNPKALQTIFKEFSILLKNINLITGNLIGVDGAFLRANASKNTLIMKTTIKKDLLKIDEHFYSIIINDSFMLPSIHLFIISFIRKAR